VATPSGSRTKGGLLRHFRRSPRKIPPRRRALKKEPTTMVSSSKLKSRQRPTLPHGCPCSTIGAERLNCRVRNGNGCGPLAMVTGKNKLNSRDRLTSFVLLSEFKEFYGQASRPISTGKLNALLHLHIRPINLVVSEGSSATEVEGYLIFGWASRLDAFSAYPFRAQLPSAAPGGTTGTLEARGFRSSRTRKPSRQVSCAHSR
jgi:hypothetical protein